MSYTELFRKFLLERGIYDKFCKNINLTYRGMRCTFDVFTKLVPIHWFVFCAFTWEETPEGGAYWEDIDTKWKMYYK